MKTTDLLKHLFTSSIFSMAFFSMTTHAEPQYSDTYHTCMSHTTLDSRTLRDCAVAETKIQDERLNTNYQQLMQNMNAKQKIALRNAHRKWIAYRDAEAQLIAAEEPGIAEYLAADMKLYLTTQRADHLKIKYQNLTHDHH